MLYASSKWDAQCLASLTSAVPFLPFLVSNITIVTNDSVFVCLTSFYSPNCCLSAHYWPGSCTSPGLRSPPAAAPASTRQSLAHSGPRRQHVMTWLAHHGDHLDPVAGGVDELVDCQEAGVPVPDPWHLSKQRLRRYPAPINNYLRISEAGTNLSVARSIVWCIHLLVLKIVDSTRPKCVKTVKFLQNHSQTTKESWQQNMYDPFNWSERSKTVVSETGKWLMLCWSPSSLIALTDWLRAVIDQSLPFIFLAYFLINKV